MFEVSTSVWLELSSELLSVVVPSPFSSTGSSTPVSEIEVPPEIHQSVIPALVHLPKPSGIGRGAAGFPSSVIFINLAQIGRAE